MAVVAVWVVWWRGFRSVVLVGMVEWRGGDQRGGFLDQRDRLWWVLALWLLARSTVHCDYVVVISCGCGCCWWFLKASLCFFFSLWWLFLVVVVGGWFELWICLDW